MLRRTALALVLAVLVALPATAWAGMKEWAAAYKRGDYATALREWRPLAEQGHAGAPSSHFCGRASFFSVQSTRSRHLGRRIDIAAAAARSVPLHCTSCCISPGTVSGNGGPDFF